MNFFSKTILFLIVFLLIFNSSGFLKSGFLKFIPPKTEAQWAVFDTAVLTQAITKYAKDIWQWMKDNWQKLMRDIIAKRIIDYIVDETVKWISGGGKPKFVSDWKGFLDDAGKIAQDSIIKEVGLAPLCKPFKLQVQIGLFPVKKFSQRIECTLDDIVKNIDNFYADFSQGGWLAYGAMWEPQNNFFGASIIAHDEALARAAKEIESRKNDAQSGKGFLSWKTCEGGKDQQSYCRDIVAQYYSGSEYQENYDYCMATSMTDEELCNETGGKMKTKTPGSVISAVTDKSQTSDTDWAANIDSWVSALVNAAINRLIKEGISELNNSNNADYSQQSYYPPEYRGQRNVELNQNKEVMIAEINKFINGWSGLLNIKEESLGYAQEILNIEQSLRNAGCSNDTAVNEAQAAYDALNLEVDELRGKISEAEALIDEINRADASNTQEWQVVLTNYGNFMEKYQADYSSFSMTGLQTARDERDEKIKEADTAQARLTFCQPPQNATTTNATST